MTKLTEHNSSLISKAKSGENTCNEQTQELELKITNLQMQLEQKNFDIKKLKTELDDREEDIKVLT